MKNKFQLKKGGWIALFLILIFLDQIGKQVASNYLPVFLNQNISFGWQFFELQDQPWFLAFFLLMITAVIAWVLMRLEGWTVGTSFFLAGAVSNVLDRFLVGGVRDWLKIPGLNLQNNLADYWIFFGVILILLEPFWLFWNRKTRE